MDWNFEKKVADRVLLKDVAKISRGVRLADHDIHVLEEGEGNNEYVVLDLKKSNVYGCVFWNSEDLVWTDKPVPEEYLTQLNDVIISFNNTERAVIVGEAEVGFIIPYDYIVVRTDKTKLLPEYLYMNIYRQKRGYPSDFFLGNEKKIFWAQFDNRECSSIGIDDYLSAEIDLRDMDIQVSERKVIRENMKMRKVTYKREKHLRKSQALSAKHSKWAAEGVYHIEGREYHLEVIESIRESVHLEGDKIIVNVVDATDAARVKRLLLKLHAIKT